MKRLIEYDPVTHTETWHDYDPVTKVTTIAEIQDVEPILESNLAARNHGVGGAKGLNEYSKNGFKKNWWHAATIPTMVIAKWKRDLGVDVFNKDHWPAVKRLLNSPDWRYLRTGTGRV